jgi:FtsP/CotA-like multicopper oxidase with cupredoxin domain
MFSLHQAGWLASLKAAAVLALGLATLPVFAGEYNLVIARTPINITGRPATAITINGQLPGPTLHWREGERIVIHVTNRLKESTSLHWHGLLLPADMDGVPGISFPGIAPGTTFTYRFTVKENGT